MSTNKSPRIGGDCRQFIAPRDVAETGLGSLRRVQEMCRNGSIPAVRFGATWRIPRNEFNQMFGTNL